MAPWCSRAASRIAAAWRHTALAKDQDILYVPYIHYMNAVNPSKGLLTGSSRFGALFFKRDGSIEVPYNVRLTHSFQDFWRSTGLDEPAANCLQCQRLLRARNPTAFLLPRFVCVDGLRYRTQTAVTRTFGLSLTGVSPSPRTAKDWIEKGIE